MCIPESHMLYFWVAFEIAVKTLAPERQFFFLKMLTENIERGSEKDVCTL